MSHEDSISRNGVSILQLKYSKAYLEGETRGTRLPWLSSIINLACTLKILPKLWSNKHTVPN